MFSCTCRDPRSHPAALRAPLPTLDCGDTCTGSVQSEHPEFPLTAQHRGCPHREACPAVASGSQVDAAFPKNSTRNIFQRMARGWIRHSIHWSPLTSHRGSGGGTAGIGTSTPQRVQGQTPEHRPSLCTSTCGTKTTPAASPHLAAGPSEQKRSPPTNTVTKRLRFPSKLSSNSNQQIQATSNARAGGDGPVPLCRCRVDTPRAAELLQRCCSSDAAREGSRWSSQHASPPTSSSSSPGQLCGEGTG